MRPRWSSATSLLCGAALPATGSGMKWPISRGLRGSGTSTIRSPPPDQTAEAGGGGDVGEPPPAAEPDGVGDGAGHPLTELVGAEARAARAAEGRVELTD